MGSLIAKDLPTLIFLLLPGFISAGVYFTLTAHPKTTEFERIVQSLIFTVFVRVFLLILKPILFRLSTWRSFGRWNDDLEFIWSAAIAVMVGLVFALFSNLDWFHGLFRRLGLSSRTSYPSEWFAAFTEYKTYVVLYLKDKRKLRGWPEQWPDQADKGHFILYKPAWISGEQAEPLHKVLRFLVPVVEVEMVEFIPTPEDLSDDGEEVDRVNNSISETQAKQEGETIGSESATVST